MTGKTIEAIEACNCGQKPAFDGTNEPHWHRNSCPIYRPPPKKPVVTIESLAAELKQLREFVGAMWNVGIGEMVGCRTLRGDSFYFHNGDYKIIASGTDPFDAWQKLQGEAK